MTLPAMMELNYTAYGQTLYQWAGDNRIPISGGIEITHRCNLRCVHCYIASDKYPKEVDTAGWIKIIDQIADAGCLWFYITGGEPMIRPDFLDIYLHAKKRGMFVTVLSNATCITDEIADTFEKYPPQTVEISMYGATPETFDRVGKVKNGYKRFMQGLEKLIVRKIPFELKTIALRENAHEVIRIRKFAERLGVSFRYDAVVNARVDYKQSPYLHQLTPAEVVELEKQDDVRKSQWQSYCSNHLNQAGSDDLYRCGAGRSTFNVDPYGRLSVCLLSRRPNYPVLQGSFLEGWKDAVQKEISKKRGKDLPCTNCNLYALCGNCPGYSELRGGEQELQMKELCEIAIRRAEAFEITYDKQEHHKL